jgi:uncharacterized protein (TIGR02246 family)
MIRIVAAALALTLGMPGLCHAQAAAGQRQEVLAFVRAYVDATNRADMTAYVDMYAQRPDLITVNDGEFTRGWDAVRNGANEMMGTEGSFRMSVGVVEVMTLSPTMAIAVFPFSATVNTQQGPRQVRGAMTLVLQKMPAGWRIIHDHTSSAAPSQ